MNETTQENKIQVLVVENEGINRLNKNIFKVLSTYYNFVIHYIKPLELKKFKNNKVHIILFDSIDPKKINYSMIEPIEHNNKRLHTALIYPSLSMENKTLVYQKHIDYIFDSEYDDKYFIAKLKNIFKRKNEKYSIEVFYEYSGIKIDRLLSEVWIDGKLLDLTRKEYKLLKELVKQGNNFIPKQAIFKSVWGYEDDPTRVLDQYLHRLKKKISPYIIVSSEKDKKIKITS